MAYGKRCRSVVMLVFPDSPDEMPPHLCDEEGVVPRLPLWHQRGALGHGSPCGSVFCRALAPHALFAGGSGEQASVLVGKVGLEVLYELLLYEVVQ